jgi:hypothetical protein
VDFVREVPISERLREPLRAALRGERASWPALTAEEVRTLTEHGVAPLVYAATALPELRSEAIIAAAQEGRRAHDVRKVLDALAAHGADALLMKGTALAYALYDVPELRPRGDTDLLVPREHLEAVRAAMQSLDFEERPSSGDEHGLRQVVFERYGHVYDVHWSVTNMPLFDAALPFADLAARAVAVPALGPHARALAPVDALLLACIHRVAHHHDSDRLIWLVDIALLRERMSREEHRLFWRMASDAKVVAICERSIEATDQWLSRASHDRAADHLSADELEREEPSRVFLDRDITHGGVMVANFRALSWRARMHRLWQLAFPPRDFVRQTFGARSKAPLPLLYVYRGARGVARLFRKAR